MLMNTLLLNMVEATTPFYRRSYTGAITVGTSMRYALLALIGLDAASCRSFSGPPDVESPLAKVIINNGFEVVTPPTSLYKPGTILSADSNLKRRTVKAFPDQFLQGVPIASSPASFLNTYSESKSNSGSLSGLQFLSGLSQESIKAELAAKRIISYEIQLGKASIQAIGATEILKHVKNMAPEYQQALDARNPVVLSTLTVDSIKITFRDNTGSEVEIGVPILSKVFGAEAKLASGSDTVVQLGSADQPVVIGLKAESIYEKPHSNAAFIDQDDEPNNQLETAIPVSSTASISGQVSAKDTADCYRFQAPTDGKLTLTVDNLARKGDAKSHLGTVDVLSENGDKLTGTPVVNSGAQKPRSRSILLSAGQTVFLRVNAFQGTHTGRYNLELHYDGN